MQDAAPAPVEEHRFPCPSCGSDLRFAPGKDGLECPHCGATTELAGGPWAGKPKELDFEAARGGRLSEADMETTRVLSCTNCGAQVEFEGATHAKECPFCAAPIVTDTGENRHIKPRGVLPFLLGEREARSAMTTWLGRLWFAPSGLRDYARQGRPMQGMYVPCWTYDAATESRYRGERGDAYYVTRTVKGADGKTTTRQERKIRWSPRSGRVARAFDDVLVLASKSLPKAQADRLGPWDLSALLAYRPEFLAGFRAEAYTVTLDEGFVEARAVMDAQIREDVRRDIGGDEQRIHSVDTDVRDVTFKHLLLPVWLAAYTYAGKSWRFIVNGRTGEVQGERPYSAWKIAVAVVLGLIVAGVVGYVVVMSEGG